MELVSKLSTAWQFWALLAAFSAALTAIFAKLGVQAISPDVATFVRTIVTMLLLFTILVFKGEVGAVGSVPRQAIGFLVLSGLATGISWLCYFRALRLGKASLVASIDKLSVVFVAVIACIFLRETLSGREWFGLGLIAAGAIIVSRG